MSNTFLALVARGSTELSLKRLYEEESNGVLKAQTRLEKDSAKVAQARTEAGTPTEPETYGIYRVRLEVVEEVPRSALLKETATTTSTEAPVATEGNTSELPEQAQ